MPSRSPPLLIALVLLSGSTCSKSDPGETKASITPAPEVAIRGIDTAMLTPRERREWTGQLVELLAPCPDVPVSIAQCIQEQRPCKACSPAAQFLLRQVQAGRP